MPKRTAKAKVAWQVYVEKNHDNIVIPFRSAIHLYLYYHVLLKVEDTDITEALAEYIGNNQLKIPLPPEQTNLRMNLQLGETTNTASSLY